MGVDPKGSEGNELDFRGEGEGNSSEEWGTSTYRSVVTGDMLVG